MTNSPLGGAAASRKLTLTIGILTLNEEDNIEACLRSASFADQVVVVDSGSVDRTTAIACSLGAQVFRYEDWQGFALQRNRLLAHAKGDYVFFLDADETISPAFREELEAIYLTEQGLSPDDDVVAYCRIGERSSHTWFVLKELLGQENVKNYDGSWTEYGSLVGVPIALGDEPGQLEGQGA